MGTGPGDGTLGILAWWDTDEVKPAARQGAGLPAGSNAMARPRVSAPPRPAALGLRRL